MRFNLRFIFSLLLLIVAFAFLSAYIEVRLHESLVHGWRPTFFAALLQMLAVVLITIILSQKRFLGLINKVADGLRELRTKTPRETVRLPSERLFAPITREVATLAKHLSNAQAAAEVEAHLRRRAETLWTPERLKEHVKSRLSGKPLIVVSNREPYSHVRQGRRIDVVVPAAGPVTALDPVLRASGGTWIAYGSGDADWDVVDDRSRIKVPPEDPRYTLKRVRLSEEELQGYYYGFSNEGLWPLCHIAHTRPVFRKEDWTCYRDVNEKFAEAVLEEIDDTEEPCFLIQDYHYALLPRLLKNKRPDAKISLFWHIPWPNPEAFGICPWQKEIIDGMLGADLIGFHIQFHCNNFLETVDRTMEARLDWERFSVTKEGRTTLVKPFPISVAFPSVLHDPAMKEQTDPNYKELLKNQGIESKFIGVGVERMDYTKGVLERFRAIERFLEKYPEYQGQFTYVQIGEPSRTLIKRYTDFLSEVDEKANAVNARFQNRGWKPIVFLKRHHSHEEILPFYKSADLCLVTSLHDGMNLVAKEFVASRDDESGALILSCFTGAAAELRDALIVNPYDIEQMADAIRFALEMPAEEKTEKMRRMRESIKEHNIYRWAGNLIEDLSKVRIEKTAAQKSEDYALPVG